MSGIELIGLLASIASLVEFGIGLSKRLQEFHDLTQDTPETFQDISLVLPLLKYTLLTTRTYLSTRNPGEDVVNAIWPLAKECESQVLVLNEILQKITPRKDDPSWRRTLKACASLLREKRARLLYLRLLSYRDALTSFHSTTSYSASLLDHTSRVQIDKAEPTDLDEKGLAGAVGSKIKDVKEGEPVDTQEEPLLPTYSEQAIMKEKSGKADAVAEDIKQLEKEADVEQEPFERVEEMLAAGLKAPAPTTSTGVSDLSIASNKVEKSPDTTNVDAKFYECPTTKASSLKSGFSNNKTKASSNIPDLSNAINAAARAGKVEAVQLLLSITATDWATTNAAKTALYEAAVANRVSVVKHLLEAKVDPNDSSGAWGRVLVATIRFSLSECALTLLEYGADPKVDGALQCAALDGKPQMLDALLDKGVNINADSKVWGTALTTVAGNIYRVDMVKHLLSRKADPNALGKGESPLQAAIKFGTIENALLLLAAGSDATPTALHAAAAQGLIEVVDDLLDRGVDVNSTSKLGTALIASSAFKIAMVKHLLHRQADPNISPGGHELPLMIAIRFQNIETSSALIAAGADTSWGALQAAAAQGLIEVVDDLLDRGVDINSTSKLGTALIASSAFKIAMVKHLLHRQADPNISVKDHELPLMIAIRFQNVATASALLAAGADTSWGALQAAASNGLDKTVDEILDKGVDINSISDKGTALYASCAFKAAMVRKLLEKGADPNLACNGDVPLFIAMRYGNTKSALLLLKAGADPNTKGALQMAAEKNLQEVVKEMLGGGGADINQISFKGTALSAAAATGQDEMVELLLSRGADPNVKGGEQAPLTIALRYGEPKVAIQLLNSGAEKDAVSVTVAAERGYTDVLQMMLGGDL
jgi:ankyrin repeat protein